MKKVVKAKTAKVTKRTNSDTFFIYATPSNKSFVKSTAKKFKTTQSVVVNNMVNFFRTKKANVNNIVKAV